MVNDNGSETGAKRAPGKGTGLEPHQTRHYGLNWISAGQSTVNLIAAPPERHAPRAVWWPKSGIL